MAVKAKKPLADVAKLTKAQAKVEHMRLALELEAPRQALLSGRRAKRHRRRIRRAAPALQRHREALSRTRHHRTRRRRRSARRHPGDSGRSGTRCRCCRSTTPLPKQDVLDFVGRIARFLKLAATTGSISPPSRRSTGCRCRCVTRAANSSPPRPAATAPRARTSPPISARSRTCRRSSKAATCPISARCAARST